MNKYHIKLDKTNNKVKHDTKKMDFVLIYLYFYFKSQGGGNRYQFLLIVSWICDKIFNH